MRSFLDIVLLGGISLGPVIYSIIVARKSMPRYSMGAMIAFMLLVGAVLGLICQFHHLITSHTDVFPAVILFVAVIAWIVVGIFTLCLEGHHNPEILAADVAIGSIFGLFFGAIAFAMLASLCAIVGRVF